MKHLYTLLLTAIALSSKAQENVKLEDISKHIGDSVTVTGQVYSSGYFSKEKGAPTVLNIGAASPNQLMTVVIWGDDRKNFRVEPGSYYFGKQISITGKVELYKKKPQIVVHYPLAILEVY